MPEIDFRAPRLFVDAALHEGGKIALERNQSNYLGNVLRLAAGDTILVFNGRDGEWQAAIEGRKRPDGLTILSQTRPQDRLRADGAARGAVGGGDCLSRAIAVSSALSGGNVAQGPWPGALAPVAQEDRATVS